MYHNLHYNNITIRCFIHKDVHNNYIISSKKKIENYTPVTLKYIKDNFILFDGQKYEKMLCHDYRKYLRNGNIKLKHLQEDVLFLRFYDSSYHIKDSHPNQVKRDSHPIDRIISKYYS